MRVHARDFVKTGIFIVSVILKEIKRGWYHWYYRIGNYLLPKNLYSSSYDLWYFWNIPSFLLEKPRVFQKGRLTREQTALQIGLEDSWSIVLFGAAGQGSEGWGSEPQRMLSHDTQDQTPFRPLQCPLNFRCLLRKPYLHGCERCGLTDNTLVVGWFLGIEYFY